jgi:hypothetical protein
MQASEGNKPVEQIIRASGKHTTHHAPATTPPSSPAPRPAVHKPASIPPASPKVVPPRDGRRPRRAFIRVTGAQPLACQAHQRHGGVEALQCGATCAVAVGAVVMGCNDERHQILEVWCVAGAGTL